MTYRTPHNWGRRFILSVILGMIFIAQSFSLAHATRYNDNSHEHNGVACEITLTSSEDSVIVPDTLLVSSFNPYTNTPSYKAFISAVYITPQGRAPPPRSPPAIF